MDVAYNFDAIAGCERSLEEQEAAWTHIFSITGCAPLRLVYEDFLKNEALELRRIHDFLGIAVDDQFNLSIPMLRVQSDSSSREWAERYKADKQERGLSLAPDTPTSRS